MFNFICPICGDTFDSNFANHNQCPKCAYWNIICSYTEDDIQVNTEEYQEILNNVAKGFRYEMSCEDCGKTGRLYLDKWCRCSCGGLMVKKINQIELAEQVKKYRKSKKWSQELMSYRLGVSRSQLAMFEAGQRELPYIAIQKFNKLLA
ncbi:helix-turn-helix transcriptional regulator [Anaerospora hongkongensis]|uniref:helix-turn-helix domain-containing protein n=1 Tax=Anaerospora hongkongensis TaxID=244830 RepID=UPI002FD8BC3B